MIPLSIPSPPPEWAEWQLGPFTIRAYALAILAGIFFAVWLTRKRWVARGGKVETIEEIAYWAIPFGIVGGRLYHVISTPGPYFGDGGDPWQAFRIWEGGLGIWGAIALGAFGAWIACRRHGVSFATFMDSAAPGILIAQAIGRLGNYFNQELFGRPTELPWGLEIDVASSYFPQQYAEGTLFHPTFLYEMIWNVLGAIAIILLDRRFRFRHGRAFWLYVMIYTAGRLWIEMVRIDEAVLVGGVRINVWVSMSVFTIAVAFFWALWMLHRREKFVKFPARSSQRAVRQTKSSAKPSAAPKKAPAQKKRPTSTK